MRPNRRTIVLLAVALSAVVAGLVTWLVWPAPAPRVDPPRERQYLDFTACLLADDRGIAGPEAAPVWAGLQDASLATQAKVQYLPVIGAQTTANALTFLATLAQGRCDVIFAVGDVPVAAARQGAGEYPHTRFVVVGQPGTASNVSSLRATTPTEVQAAVKKTVVDAAPQPGG